MKETGKEYGVSVMAIVAIVAATFVCALFSPWAGDDLAYGEGYANYYGGSIFYYPRWVLRHWFFSNGRAANYLATLLMHFTPMWFVAMLNALATGLFYWMLLKWATIKGLANAFVRVFIIAFVLFAFCWWDGFFLIDVSLNYVWATTLALLWAWWFFTGKDSRDGLGRNLFLAVFSVVAGCMHEAVSAPLLCGIVAWMFLSGQSLDARQKWLLPGFVLGTACVFFSPGIWSRLNSESAPDDTMLNILLKSDWLVLVMLAVFASSLCWKSQRERWRRLIATPFIVWPIAAIGSMCFSAVGGIVGRSGWFATSFALIAMAQWGLPYLRLGRQWAIGLSLPLLAVILLFLGAWVKWQVRTGTEMREILAQYKENPSSPVFHDYTLLEDVPPYLLNRLRLVPDADNYYELFTVRAILGDSISQPTFLPAALEGIRPWQVGPDGLKTAGGIVMRQLPAGQIREAPIWASDSVPTSMPNLPASPIIIADDGSQSTAQPFVVADTLLYYISPRQINPGDR